MDTITERTKNLIAYKTTPAKRFKELEEITRIPSGTWRTWWNKNSKPSGEMIEAIASIWPEHAFWLSTGLTDQVSGHIGIREWIDQDLKSLDVWGDKKLPYSNALFREIIQLREVMIMRREAGGDGSISGSERQSLNSTKEMRLKELEHQLLFERRSLLEELSPYSEEVPVFEDDAMKAWKYHKEMAEKIAKNDPLKKDK